VLDGTVVGPCWPNDAYLIDETPVVVIGADDGTHADTSFWHAEWDGAAWDVSEVLASSGLGVVDPGGPIAALDRERPGEVYLTRWVGGQSELWRYIRSGASWSGTALTSGSADPQLYPSSVKGHSQDGIAIVWLTGDYEDYTTFDLGILGLAWAGAFPSAWGEETGFLDGLEVASSGNAMVYPTQWGEEAGFLPGLVVRAFGPRQVALVGSGLGTSEMTEGGSQGYTLTYNEDAKPSWEVPGAGIPATTVTDETTWGISPAVGTDTEYARAGHTHGTPANPVTGPALVALGVVGPLLIADDHSTPIVFGDLLLTEEGDDLLYADIGG
jgi:hypothetical protein